MTMRRLQPAMIGGFIALTGFTAGTALGDVITAQWNHNTSFSYEITHMPDLDQRRQAMGDVFGLPGNGSMYCVPTSTMNMFMYAANHGFPNVLPGPGNWQSNSLYNEATINILLLGLDMGTHAQNGTGGGGWHDGAVQWLTDSGEINKFTVQLKYFTGALGPNLNSLAKSAINGHLVSLGYGRYTYLSMYKGLPMYKRTGGHIVTMSKAFRNGSEQKLWVRDPADDFNLTSQSTFMNLMWEIENKAVYARIEGEPKLRLFSAMGYEAPPAKANFIDGALFIRPKAGYSFTDTGGILTIFQNIPWPLIGSPTPQSEFTVNVPGAFINGVMASNGADVYTINQIAGVPNRITCTDLLTDEAIGLGEFPGAFQLALSPTGQLYILTPNQLHCMNLMEEERPLESVELPAEGSAMAYDPKSDAIVVLSAQEHVLLKYPDLTMPPSVMPIPNDIPMEGAAVMSVDPSTGMYWFATEASDMLFGWMMSDTGLPIVDQIMAPGLGMPTSFDFDDAGHVYITDGTSLVEMMKTATAGWQPVADSAFAGPGGQVFQMTKSELTLPPLSEGVSYYNIDPAELEFGEPVIDCYEDLDDNRVVGVADLLLLLAAWGECGNGPCAADLTEDRNVGVADLLQLLAAWGDCP